MPGLALRNSHFRVKTEDWSLQRSLFPTGSPLSGKNDNGKGGASGTSLKEDEWEGCDLRTH